MRILALSLFVLISFFAVEARNANRGRRNQGSGGNRGQRQDQRTFGRTGEDWDDDLEVDWPNADDFQWDDMELDRRSNVWHNGQRQGGRAGRTRFGFLDGLDDLDWMPHSGRRGRGRRRHRGRGRHQGRRSDALIDVDVEEEDLGLPTLDTDPDLRLVAGRNPSTTPNRRGFGQMGRLSAALGLPDWFFDGPSIDFSINFGLTGGFEWWKGQNVCLSKETKHKRKSMPTAGLFSMIKNSRCEDRGHSYDCETTFECSGWHNTTILKYRCCHGYQRIRDASGCTGVVQMTDLLDTARNLDISEFLSALESVGLNDSLSANNLTVFAPGNVAFQSYVPEEVDIQNYVVLSPETTEIITSTRKLLEGHIVPMTMMQTSDFTDNHVLQTANPDSTIRINRYPKKVFTANCAKFVAPDNLAENGVIHVLDRIVVPAKDNVVDILRKNPELHMLRKALNSAGLTEILRQDGPFTLFAPTNAAINKLKPSIRNRLLNGATDSCLSNILKAHILPEVLCSVAISNRTRTTDLLRNNVYLTKAVDQSLFVDDAEIIMKDVIATNGVIHIIDKVLESQAVLDLADREGATDIVTLFHEANLDSAIDSKENVTFFLPTNEAIAALPDSKLAALKREPRALRSLLNYHIASPPMGYSDLENGMKLSTLNGKDIVITETTSDLPTLLRKTTKTIQCGRVVKSNLWTCTDKAVVHIIDKVLIPPEGNIMDTLVADGRFSIFVGLLQQSGGLDDLLTGAVESYTVFAPTDKSMEDIIISTDSLDSIRQFVKSHVVRGSLCCASFNDDEMLWSTFAPRLQNLAGRYLTLMSEFGKVKVSNVEISTCDITATNGVIHAIEGTITQGRRGWIGELFS